MASKLGGQYKKAKAYNLNTVEAFYLQGKQPGGNASMFDMAEMFALKYQKDGYLEGGADATPQFFIQLIFKILLAKFEVKPEEDVKFAKAMQFLDEHKRHFGIELEFMKLRLQAQIVFRLRKEKAGVTFEWKPWFDGIVADLMQVIRGNFENVKEFQSIQNLHELLVSICVENIQRTGAQLDQTSEQLIESITHLKGTPFTFDPSLGATDQLFFTVASFAAFEKFGVTEQSEDKSTNAHNCRKSSALTQMFAIHKMLSLLNADPSITSRLSTLFNWYASSYIELPSMVSDLSLFSLYLTSENKQTLLKVVLPQALESKRGNQGRYSKAQIGFNKLKFILGFEAPQTFDELIAALKELVKQFHSGLAADEKPEKGERKLVDEQALLISDVVDQWLVGKPLNADETKQLQLFKICLLEYNYEKSCYNFDVQLSLLKTFDTYGLSPSFIEAYDTMDIKGVQLETLGFLSTSHALKWAYFT